MKRIIEVEGEVEQVLTQICDTALKGGGLAIHQAVNKLIGAIKTVEEKFEKVD